VRQTRNILGVDQMGKFRMLLHPSQLRKYPAQRQEQIDIGFGNQRRHLGAEVRHPAEDVGITSQ